ncbi:MAG: penicillin-binding protein [Chitinophagaceae bacterium]
MDIKKDILWRVYLCFLGIIVLGVIVLGRAFYIQRIQGKYWTGMSDSLHLKYMPINAERGSIYSEDGNMLSTSIPVFNIYIDFGADGLREKFGKRFYDNIDSLSMSLAGLFNDASAKDYKKQLSLAYKNEDRYYLLKRKISFERYKQLRDFVLVREGRNKSGFIIDVHDSRVNPYVLLANRTICLSRGDTSKNVGLERTYDSLLKGQTGQRLMRYMAGVYIPVDGAEIEPENGKDIITTIDTYMQDVAENALLKMMVTNNSLHGTCIVMETTTGKIKAIANLGKRPDGTYMEDYNYGIGKKTEPGSIFKLATLLSLLEDKHVDTNTIVDCEGGSKLFYGLRIRDSHLGSGKITVKEAFARSSNVAFAKLAEEYYHNNPRQFYDHLHHLRLDTATGIDIVGQASPLIKKPGGKFWGKTTLPFMAHGYEELVTPLHMLMVYNAVANNGRMMKPYLVNSVREMGVDIKSFTPNVLVEKICNDETLGKLKACLLDVVESAHGTAHSLKTDLYSFAGKTGTAVTAMDNHGYNKANKIYQSSFIGFFPAEKPMYSIAVVIQNGNESRLAYGGVVSAPVFREVADKIYASNVSNYPFFKSTPINDSSSFNYYGLKNDINNVLSVLNLPYLDSAAAGYWRSINMYDNKIVLNEINNPSAQSVVMPRVLGLGLKDAVYMLENYGLKVIAGGRGKVIYQSLQEGITFTKGQTINIQLN